MSEKKDIEVLPTHDFTEKDLEDLRLYKEAGLPDISRATDVDILKMLDLYLQGKRYSQIARITRLPKVIVLYCSEKFQWFEKKQEFIRDLEQGMIQRTLDAKLMGQDFLLQIKSFFEKKIGGNIAMYLATNDEKYAEKINLKDIDKYLKTFDSLEKLTAVKVKVPAKTQVPTIGLNLIEGATIHKKDDNTIEVTPKSQSHAQMLQELAKFRKEEAEKKK